MKLNISRLFNTRLISIFVVVVFSLNLFGCGYKGPLVLPNSNSSQNNASTNLFAPHGNKLESLPLYVDSHIIESANESGGL